MRKSLVLLVLSAFTFAASHASEARILKVLPHLLDTEGRQSLSPSLYERDAYQAVLHKDPALRGTVQFDIQWKATKFHNSELIVRVELRMSLTDSRNPTILETRAKPSRWLSKWTSLKLDPRIYAKQGKLVAWRATLWDENKQLGEVKSFLW